MGEIGPVDYMTTAAAPVAEAAPPDYMEELEQLAQLGDQEILSREELEAKK